MYQWCCPQYGWTHVWQGYWRTDFWNVSSGLEKVRDQIARDHPLTAQLTEGVVVEDGGGVHVGDVGQVGDDAGQDVGRGPHLHAEMEDHDVDELSHAIKTQVKAPKAPDEIPSRQGYIIAFRCVVMA